MSRGELDQIQADLKLAIQTHQGLVSRIQVQPKNQNLKARLHELQKDILAMSQKQKSLVQKLRTDLIVGKAPSSSQEDTALHNDASISCHSDQYLPVSEPSSSPLRVPHYLGNGSSPNQSEACTMEVDYANSSPPSTPCDTSKPSCDVKNKSDEKKDKKQKVAENSYKNAQELKRKIDFMASINLIPPDSIKENCVKRSERKRKSTNNPNFAYGFELERRPKMSNYLATDYFGVKKPVRARPPLAKTDNVTPPIEVTPTGDNKPDDTTSPSLPDNQLNTKENKELDNQCHVCGTDGQLLSCDKCSNVYHQQCVSPPLPVLPTTQWTCPKCQEANTKSVHSLAAVNAYIALKTGKEEEKRKMLKRSSELLKEKSNLENRTKQLNEILARQGIRKQELIDINVKAKQSVENLKKFIKAVKSS